MFVEPESHPSRMCSCSCWGSTAGRQGSSPLSTEVHYAQLLTLVALQCIVGGLLFFHHHSSQLEDRLQICLAVCLVTRPGICGSSWDGSVKGCFHRSY